MITLEYYRRVRPPDEHDVHADEQVVQHAEPSVYQRLPVWRKRSVRRE